MGFVVLVVLAILAAVLQHTVLATVPWAPDVPLALLAWATVAGDERLMLVRAWTIGLVRDCVDPGSTCFHTVAYFLLALAFLPARSLVFHGRAAAWIASAFTASLLLAAIDRLLGGVPLLHGWGRPALVALLTALATLPIGWLFGGLPRAIRPVGGTAA